MPVAVYNAMPGEDAATAWDLLTSAGLEPVYLSDPNPDPSMGFAALGTYRVQIGVDQTQVARAVGLLDAYDAAKSARTRSHNPAAMKAMLLGFGLLTAFILVVYLLNTRVSWNAATTVLVIASALSVGPFACSAFAQTRRYLRERSNRGRN